MDKQELRWERVRSEHILQDTWIDIRRVAYRMPDGQIMEPFYSFSRRSYVVVVATDEEGKYICVCQFRFGIEDITTEFVAGGIETKGKTEYLQPGEDKSHAEDFLEAARRELLEETGYASEEWEHLMSIPANATISDNFAYIVRARNCKKVDVQHLDTAEYLQVELHTKEEIEELIREGKFQQAMHVLAWFLAKESEKNG